MRRVIVYQALYRVWRPQSFKDVVGQEAVVKTLQNAVKENRISHAYLFTGTRGTGKTSLAKIFAKAINCPHAVDGEPCNQCDICSNITKGSLADIVEIDAASNNGVDEIRDIRDKSRYAATITKYKVYIIDEVHMLSIGAFNALLKTLEEPSENVVFILATTEPHKIPQTIISRVQRYDFKRIPDVQILNRLEYILNNLKITYTTEALNLIVRYAQGGMRDALSLLDQILAINNEHITYEIVCDITGSITQDLLVKYIHLVLDKDVVSALNLIKELLSKGKSVQRIVEELIFTIRDILLSPYDDNIHIDTDFNINQLYHLLQELTSLQQQLKMSMQQELYLEIFTIKQGDETSNNSSAEHVVDMSIVTELQKKVQRLQEEIEKIKGKSIPLEHETSNVTATQSIQNVKIDIATIFNVLHRATSHHKHEFEANFHDMLQMLIPLQRAKLKNTVVLAVSPTAVLLGFEYDSLCTMTATDTQLHEKLKQITMKLLSHEKSVVCVPLNRWQEIRNQYIIARKENQLHQYGIGESTDQQVSSLNSTQEHENNTTTHNMPSLDLKEKGIDVSEAKKIDEKNEDVVEKATALFGDIVEVEEN